MSYLVLDEFEKRPFGLVLPIGKIVKRFDNKRYKRVAFKIARGLIFYEEGLLIDPNALHRITNFSFSDEIPNDVEIINYLPSKGKYPGVFDYKYYVTDKMVFVSMLLFDKLILNIYMQSPYTKSTTSLT